MYTNIQQIQLTKIYKKKDTSIIYFVFNGSVLVTQLLCNIIIEIKIYF